MNSFFIISFIIIIFIVLIYFFGDKLQSYLQSSTKKIINKNKSTTKKSTTKKSTNKNDTKENDTKENDTKENDTKENYTKENYTSQNNITVILCYADWCSHCPYVKEWFIDLVDKSPLSNVKFIAIEEKKIPKEIINKIGGFPTILININDSMEIYNGSRSKESLLTYLETL